MPVGDILPELALIGGGVACLLFALFTGRERQGWSAAIALAALVISATLVARADAPQRLTFSGTWSLDHAAIAAKLVILAGTAVVVGLSVRWFRGDARHGELYTLLLFAALGAIVLASAADVMELVIGVLLSSVTGYFLTAYHRQSPRAAEAAVKYYLMGALLNALMVMGAVLLFGAAATTGYRGWLASLPGASGAVAGAGIGAPATAAVIGGMVLLVLGLLFKAGAVPAHAWMPDVAEAAPAPMAAFLTVVPKVGALVGLARLVTVLPEDTGWRAVIAVAAAATMTLGNLAAFWQDDVRRLLGWSAVSQSGYALMGVAVLGLSDTALPALLFFLAAYAAANLAAFGFVVVLGGRAKLAEYAGLARRRPLVALGLTISLLSLIGIPPLAGFAGKLSLFLATIDAGYTWLAVVAAANTVASVFYYARVMVPMYFDEGTGEAAVFSTRAVVATSVSVLAVIGLGLVAEPVMAAVGRAVLLP